METLKLDVVRGKVQQFATADQVRPNRIRITTTPDHIRDSVGIAVRDLSCDRLVTISTADNGRTLELIYHLTGPHRTVISIALELPRDTPATPTMSDLLLPAGLYERQIHDLFGIVFTGRPEMKRLILNEDWPLDEYPLRKDWSPEPGRFYGGLKEERS